MCYFLRWWSILFYCKYLDGAWDNARGSGGYNYVLDSEYDLDEEEKLGLLLGVIRDFSSRVSSTIDLRSVLETIPLWILSLLVNILIEGVGKY